MYINKMDYCYIAAPEDHYDLEDCFDGVYDKEKKAWRFNISQKEEVLNFLSPDGDEETPDEDVVDYLNKHTKAKPKRSRSIHRARSACTNKSSDSDLDLDSELDLDLDLDLDSPLEPHKTEKTQQSTHECVPIEKVQTVQKQKVQEIKKLIK